MEIIIIRQCLLKSFIEKLFKKAILKYRKNTTSLINKEFDNESIFGDNDKHIKTKIKSYGDKTNTDFQDKKMAKGNISYQ